jgi:hypothetical protein
LEEHLPPPIGQRLMASATRGVVPLGGREHREEGERPHPPAQGIGTRSSRHSQRSPLPFTKESWLERPASR